mmetsp:Transcript_3934/g.8197  ORF Transcript_3934/g.8197 Transcript_3934/m.8197 type:complete len:224 (-) Transcript_3934:629-1300(-)
MTTFSTTWCARPGTFGTSMALSTLTRQLPPSRRRASTARSSTATRTTRAPSARAPAAMPIWRGRGSRRGASRRRGNATRRGPTKRCDRAMTGRRLRARNRRTTGCGGCRSMCTATWTKCSTCTRTSGESFVRRSTSPVARSTGCARCLGSRARATFRASQPRRSRRGCGSSIHRSGPSSARSAPWSRAKQWSRSAGSTRSSSAGTAPTSASGPRRCSTACGKR